MPPRDDELPEGTDHIINGAMETGGGDDGTGDGFGGGGGTGGTGGTTTGGGGASSGFIGSGAGTDTGGSGAGGAATGGALATAGGGGTGDTGSTGGTGGTGGGSGNVIEQLKSEAMNLRGEAGTRVRDLAEGGKTRATEALDEFSRVVSDAAASIDERLGAEYGEYARRAADAVSDFADNLREKEVDELYEQARSVVRKSPGIAIGAAAVIGFTLVRLIKAGLPEDDGNDSESGTSASSGTSA